MISQHFRRKVCAMVTFDYEGRENGSGIKVGNKVVM